MEATSLHAALQHIFSQPARTCLRRTQRICWQQQYQPKLQRRCYRSLRAEKAPGESSKWQQRLDAFPKNMSQQLKEYPSVTAADLKHRTQRPRRVKMLTRDFIEGRLYNPNYGYFSKHATIYNSARPFDFDQIADESEFHRLVDQSYVDFEDALDEVDPNENRQLWHTPTELFRPHYGEAIARYLVHSYKMTLYPYHDLIIYEIGAGNGTMMRNVLDYIREMDEHVYHRTQFKIIEISKSLADLQLMNLRQSPYNHTAHVEVINKSILEWDQYIHSPCFFLALEVIDNLSHDSIRYDPETESPLQGSVLIDEDGEFFEFYVRNIDPVASRYLHIRNVAARSNFDTPISGSRFVRRLKHSLPFAPNLTFPEYIPTRMMQLFDTLHRFFPAHRLVLSDFTSLPTVVPGMQAPIVQTRYQRRNVMVTTPFVHQGYFDIFFPTDFAMMEDIYRAITGKLTRVSTHHNFLQNWAYIEDTQTQSGENPMLSWYRNASVMTTV